MGARIARGRDRAHHEAVTWRRDELPKIASTLAGRPRHDNVRVLLADVLRYGFRAEWDELRQEVRAPNIGGRLDTLFGATVFEIKSDLRRERGDVEARLPDYLADRERETGRRFLGIATDGRTWEAYELRDGALAPLGKPFDLDPARPDTLLAWLEPALADRDDLPPEPRAVQRALGRDSFAFGHARATLLDLWKALRDHPEVALKRQLWDGLLREVYGQPVGNDALFLQHTYLTVVAKTIAARALQQETDSAEAILSGALLEQEGIYGAVEGDFFDWVLLDPRGAALVLQVARQAARFRLRDVQADVLKALYESLIDPDQRHDLGEYYTPDWLATKVVSAAVASPLDDRVLDPACGSGTFLFHAVRHLLAAAKAAGLPDAEAVRRCAEQVRGLDVHPVAVIIARVTWLLALGPAIAERQGDLYVPVFLGDAMQWNVGVADEVRIPVPGEPPLSIPAGFAESQARFAPGVQALANGLHDKADTETVRRNLLRIEGVTQADATAMAATYARLYRLYKDGKDGIWPFVMRNLVRPRWLSLPSQRADVVLGNPPWVAYRYLSPELKTRVREDCKALGLWEGGHLATQQDLCALFWARSVDRYLKPGGTIAFVLPYAALNRPAYAGLRKGLYGTAAQARIVAAWSFDEDVQPLFPVPACVLIARRAKPGPLPAQVTRYSGSLPRRDANEVEADRALRHTVELWPPVPTLEGASPYRARFKQGATIVPRRFFFVEPEQAGRLGMNPAAPRMHGRVSTLDKRPWNTVEPPRGPVEKEFLRPVLLGESLAPFRLLKSAMAVIPLDGRDILDAKQATDRGYRGLAAWLRDVETKWSEHSNKDAHGKPRMTLRQRLDHQRGLTMQTQGARLRLIYAASGTLPAAVVTDAPEPIVEHKAYWATIRTVEEGDYLAAIINSEATRARIAAMQSRGQGGARDFDNLVWELPIPEFDARNTLHQELANAGAEASRIAAHAAVNPGQHFTRQRKVIRDALLASGVATRIDALVAQLLNC